jgi:hypothetical protein
MSNVLRYMICVSDLKINVPNFSSIRICNFEMVKRNNLSSWFNINYFFENKFDGTRMHI